VGGDEFVVLLSDLNEDQSKSIAQAALVAEKVRIKLSQPYWLRNADNTIEHHCTASIGVMVFAGDKSSQEEILKWADTAMYQAKDAGRNAIRFYERPVDTRSTLA
jgi:diguanylate cyclase (GGDEF)-like protein